MAKLTVYFKEAWEGLSHISYAVYGDMKERDLGHIMEVFDRVENGDGVGIGFAIQDGFVMFPAGIIHHIEITQSE